MTLQLTAQVIIPCNWKLFTYSLHCLWNILKVISYTLVSFILDYCLEVLFYELFTLRLRHILIWYFGSFLPDIFTQSKIYEIIYTESTSTQRLQKTLVRIQLILTLNWPNLRMWHLHEHRGKVTLTLFTTKYYIFLSSFVSILFSRVKMMQHCIELQIWSELH